MEKTIELPWPPSTGVYFRIFKNRFVKTARAKRYLQTVFAIVKEQKIKSFGNQKISVHIAAFPPDKRRRDLDNLCKVSLDALCDSGVYQDDFNIDELCLKRMHVTKGGKLLVKISVI